MNRQQKEAVVADFKKLFTESQAAFLVKYQGLNVEQMQTLRKDLREINGTFKVTKARLMKVAAHDVASQVGGIADFQENFHDQIGVAFTKADVSELAKLLVKFAEKNEVVQVLSGLYESKLLSAQDIKTLAMLPSRDVLIAMIARTLQEPIAQFARVLNLLTVRLCYALKEVAEQKSKSE